jgi:hypothetical protein
MPGGYRSSPIQLDSINRKDRLGCVTRTTKPLEQRRSQERRRRRILLSFRTAGLGACWQYACVTVHVPDGPSKRANAERSLGLPETAYSLSSGFGSICFCCLPPDGGIVASQSAARSGALLIGCCGGLVSAIRTFERQHLGLRRFGAALSTHEPHRLITAGALGVVIPYCAARLVGWRVHGGLSLPGTNPPAAAFVPSSKRC